MLTEYRLGMKLHAFDVIRRMANSHDLIDIPVFSLSPGRDFQRGRQAGFLNDQGMIARRLEGVVQASENTDTGMLNH